MKIKIIILNILLGAMLTACAQVRPEAQITFKVIDESGKPVPNVPVGTTVFDHSNLLPSCRPRLAARFD